MTNKQENIISTIIGAFVMILIGLLFYGVISMRNELRDYKQAYEILKETQNTVVLQMDESCYEQFTNNMNKALYIKMRFEGGR